MKRTKFTLRSLELPPQAHLDDNVLCVRHQCGHEVRYDAQMSSADNVEHLANLHGAPCTDCAAQALTTLHPDLQFTPPRLTAGYTPHEELASTAARLELILLLTQIMKIDDRLSFLPLYFRVSCLHVGWHRLLALLLACPDPEFWWRADAVGLAGFIARFNTYYGRRRAAAFKTDPHLHFTDPIELAMHEQLAHIDGKELVWPPTR